MTEALDRRVYAVDEARRVAEGGLQGQLAGSWTWVTPQSRVASSGRVSIRARPEEGSVQVTEVLFGEAVEVLEERDHGWGWVRTVHDRYLGFAPLNALSQPTPGRTLQVSALRGHLFAAPQITASILDQLSHGASLTPLDPHPVEEKGRSWWRISYQGKEAYVQTALVDPVEGGTFKNLTFIQRFLDTPYVWGGRSAWGIDCSGLAQLFHAGQVPRDADQQEASLARVESPQPGDLAFFPGHVGIMLNDRDLLHANATYMRVTVETLGQGEYGQRLAEELRGYGRLSLRPAPADQMPA